jgi:hypothetical protein
MTIDQLVSAVAAVIFGVAFIRNFSNMIGEFNFYRLHDWNFSKDSPRSGKATYGDIITPRDIGKPIDNKTRVTIVLPLFAFGAAVGTTLAIFFLITG